MTRPCLALASLLLCLLAASPTQAQSVLENVLQSARTKKLFTRLSAQSYWQDNNLKDPSLVTRVRIRSELFGLRVEHMKFLRGGGWTSQSSFVTYTGKTSWVEYASGPAKGKQAGPTTRCKREGQEIVLSRAGKEVGRVPFKGLTWVSLECLIFALPALQDQLPQGDTKFSAFYRGRFMYMSLARLGRGKDYYRVGMKVGRRQVMTAFVSPRDGRIVSFKTQRETIRRISAAAAQRLLDQDKLERTQPKPPAPNEKPQKAEPQKTEPKKTEPKKTEPKKTGA